MGLKYLLGFRLQDLYLFEIESKMFSQNVMLACSQDMLFMFVCAGWEGTAHDTRVFVNVVLTNTTSENSFRMPSAGKFIWF